MVLILVSMDKEGPWLIWNIHGRRWNNAPPLLEDVLQKKKKKKQQQQQQQQQQQNKNKNKKNRTRV